MKVAYQRKGIYIFSIKFKYANEVDCLGVLDTSIVLINNSRFSIMLLWSVTFKLCRCVTIYEIKTGITIQYNTIQKISVSCGFSHIYWRNPEWKNSFFVQCKYIISTQNTYDYWHFATGETPHLKPNSYILHPTRYFIVLRFWSMS